MEIQWFPGHMTKTKRLIRENIGKVDVVIEVLDARAPFSSRNPLLASLINNKPRVIIFNKDDLADPEVTKLWTAQFESENTKSLRVSSKNKQNLSKIVPICRSLATKKVRFRGTRAMIVGIPNCGKSTLMNALVKGKKAQVGDTPGVTRGIQLVNLTSDFQIFDTPGILWHKFEDQEVGNRLAVLGTIKDSILGMEEMADWGYREIKQHYPDAIKKRYELETLPDEISEFLDLVAKKRGCLKKGGESDTERAATSFIKDLREGRMGRISVERPPLNYNRQK